MTSTTASELHAIETTIETSNILLVDTGGARTGPAMEHAAACLQAALLAGRGYVWMIGSTVVYPRLAAGKIAALDQLRSPSLRRRRAAGERVACHCSRR